MIEISLKEKLLEAMKIRGVKVPKLSKETGIPQDRIYKWFQQGTHPKEEDSLKLEKWINGRLDVIPEKSIVSDFKPDYGHDFSSLVKAHLLLVESNARLSIAHERLSARVETTVRENEETRLAAAANIDALRDILKEQAVESGLFQSGRAFLEAYDKKVNEFVKKKKGVDIAPGSDKQSKKKA